ncbi:MAG: hypothetical protein KGM24_13765 [Elusimicrobia bacterium]|nr:hypothetical protein [Elusimicrobiota bacterium]
MNDDENLPPIPKPGQNLKARPSRARYDAVKRVLDVKWRRRAPQPERMMREAVDALWDAFEASPWTWCGFWLLQPDGRALQPGPARPEAAPSAVALEGLLGEALAGAPRRAEGRIAVGFLDRANKPWAVFEARATAPFEDMDARWLEQLLKVFRDVERPAPPPL